MPGRPLAAVVTGSTSGIGLAIAQHLAGAGYNVALNYARDDERAATAAAQCPAADGRNVILVKADISTSGGAASLISRATGTFGGLDVLVNNAAQVIDKPALELTEDDWDRVLDVNLKGALMCSQHAARQMLTQPGGGVIINIGASTGIRGRHNGVNTCASKAGLMIMTQCLALELAPTVRVNTIIPGLVVTDETTSRFHLDNPDVRAVREQAVPMHRLGTTDDIANAVMMLLSPQARFINGQRIVVDGGQNMW
jgi:3-oxoacyl-[acyl-carrier protein] reductase